MDLYRKSPSRVVPVSNSTTEAAPRFAPLTALLVGLLVTGIYYIVGTVVFVLQFWAIVDTAIDADGGKVESVTWAWFGYYSEPATAVIAVVNILAGAVGFVALKRSDRISNLTHSTLMVGVAIGVVIGFGFDVVVYWMLPSGWVSR